MHQFDDARSFFPLILYHALHGEVQGRRYDFADYAAAGFNAAHLWEQQDPLALADAAAAAKIQLVVHHPSDDIVKALANHPAVLAWYLDEEPTGAYWGQDMDKRFAQFLRRREQIKQLDPHRAVFPLDVPWIMEPARSWWVKWNSAGDVSCHDNYPINQHRQTLSFENGIPEVVSLAVSSVDASKPVWLCAQAFENHDPRFPFNMPSGRQLRCMVYTSIVHGATGVMYFALDSWVTREGNVVGMAPDPQPAYGSSLAATGDQMRMSRELWQTAAAINREIAQLRPALLSPTATLKYEVDLDDTWPTLTPDPLRTLLKHDRAGGWIMLLVNVDASPVSARVRIAGMRAEQLFEVPGAGRFRASDEGFELLCGPHDVRVVRLMKR